MPVYHFHVRDGVTIFDTEGQELPNLDAARKIAVSYASSLIRELGDAFWNGSEWALQVTDPAGLIFFELVFFATHAPASQRLPAAS